MAILSLHDIYIAFGGSNILNGVTFQIKKNQRICLLGRNGAGKTTLMRIINGDITPDRGEVRRQKGLRVAYLPQKLPVIHNKTVFEVLAHTFDLVGESLTVYHKLHTRLHKDLPAKESKILNDAQHQLDIHDGWAVYQRIEKIISLLQLDSCILFNTLSGGHKRRVFLGSTLVKEPDLLLLDEPTNHIDLDSVIWLEDFLIRMGITLLFVTHDRMFLKKLATRIIELDRGLVSDWSCNYDTFVKRKQAVLEAEEKEWKRFDKKLAQEETWIRRGIKARRTRNEGRVRALKKMREERSRRRELIGTVSMNLQNSERSGRLVLKAKDLSFNYSDTCIVRNFSTTILRGDKIGIIGPNGSGKTTLINLLLGKLSPKCGSIKSGTNIQIIYFDQLRDLIDETRSVQENVLPNGEMVEVNGKNRHIMSYLRDFLFTPEKAKTPVCDLSGGEKNRLALAKLFTKKSNLLVFDEPTNDLDIETLELLEELLVDYAGTILLVSHDREFLNNIVTSILVIEGNGNIGEYIGGYDNWHNTKKKDISIKKNTITKSEKKRRNKISGKPKLSYNDKRELEALPNKIEILECEIDEVNKKLIDPEIYRIKENIVELRKKLASLEQELSHAYNRWEELESFYL
jgi:ATP-binding cassette subfamily F protein uup